MSIEDLLVNTLPDSIATSDGACWPCQSFQIDTETLELRDL